MPSELNPVAEDAESRLPEETTFLAGTAAIALQRWGYDVATIIIGYQHSAGLVGCNANHAETYAAVLLADWIATLYRDAFNLERWHNLCHQLVGIERFPRLQSTWQLCLPE